MLVMLHAFVTNVRRIDCYFKVDAALFIGDAAVIIIILSVIRHENKAPLNVRPVKAPLSMYCCSVYTPLKSALSLGGR
eukprot:scaffold43303_cov26-Prasinocladus_malaysianus.AAC.2